MTQNICGLDILKIVLEIKIYSLIHNTVQLEKYYCL